MEQTGRNESEPHQMSLEKSKTGDKPSPYPWGEGRREQAAQQSEPAQRSGGVCVDSTSGSPVRVNWENSGDGKSQQSAQAGSASEAQCVPGEVGVPHSSVDLHYFKRCKEPSGDTYAMRRGEAKDAGMAGATRIVTPDKVRQLQITLYRKAKASPKYRFWSLYGELLRMEGLERALDGQFQNGGGAGGEGERRAGSKRIRKEWLSE